VPLFDPAIFDFTAFDTDGQIWVGVCGGATFDWEDRDTGVTGSLPRISCDRRATRPVLYLTYVSGGSILRRTSNDEGVTWSVPATIAAGTGGGTVEFQPTGARCTYWIASGTLRGKIDDALGNALVATFDVDSGVEDNGVDSRERTGDRGEWLIDLIYTKGGNIVTVTSRDGRTFS